jgi:hypothetical protein
MLLVITLPISALMIAVLQTRYSDVTIVNQVSSQTEVSAKDIVGVEIAKEARELILQATQGQALIRAETQRVEQLSQEGLELIEDCAIDTQRVFDQLLSLLTEDELTILNTIFEQSFASDSQSTQQRGTAKIRIYFQFGVGYLAGRLATSLVTKYIITILGKFSATGASLGGVLGAIICALVGTVVGAAIAYLIDLIVSRIGDINFYYSLVSGSAWWFWNMSWEANVVDYILDLMTYCSVKRFDKKQAALDWLEGTIGNVTGGLLAYK